TFLSDSDGIFFASVVTAMLASGFIALGMRTYAKVQKFCFYGGLVGLAVMILLLLFNSKASFITNFNLTPNVPVMAAPGDEFVVSVGVFNNTTAAGPIRLEVQGGPGLAIQGP